MRSATNAGKALFTVLMLKRSDVLAALASRPDLIGKTVNKHVSVLREAMELTVADKTIATNPLHGPAHLGQLRPAPARSRSGWLASTSLSHPVEPGDGWSDRKPAATRSSSSGPRPSRPGKPPARSRVSSGEATRSGPRTATVMAPSPTATRPVPWCSRNLARPAAYSESLSAVDPSVYPWSSGKRNGLAPCES